MIIAIDGPSAAGKSTIAKELAKRLAYPYLESGLGYRAMAWAAMKEGVGVDDADSLRALAQKVDISLDYESKEGRALVDGRDVTAELRNPGVSEAASAVSRFPFVREKVVKVQRRAAVKGNLVAEGRDMGTVVFPEAEMKFFLDATPEVRARRRLLDWHRQGVETQFEDVLAELATRDARDSSRQASPLRAAEDAIRVDTSNLSIEETVQLLLKRVNERRNSGNMV